ncbi:MAG: SGNH/GDSL hydrolase family protein [bacterium]|nr:SGNH/GDSL hydrolase family protein [bacterium]
MGMLLAAVALATAILLAAANAQETEKGKPTTEKEYSTMRGSLDNCRVKFERERKARVAYLGGSITHMDGWRRLVSEMLAEWYPDTEFDFIDAGIPSTDTAMGAARVEPDAFGQGPVDLLFVEFAVNDSTNGRSATESVRGMEGIIRRARRLNPNVDIIMMYFVDPDKMDAYRAGGVPEEVVSHEKVAEHYRISSIDLAREVTERIDAGEFDWDTFGGIHPAPFGHQVYRNTIERLLKAAWDKPLPDVASLMPHPAPMACIDPLNYENSRYVSIEEAKVESGWQRNPEWAPSDKAGTRPMFVNVPMLTADAPGATLTFDFEGTAVGVVVAAGPDVGIFEFAIDDGPTRTVDQFTQWSSGLHIPWAYIFDADLEPGSHTLTLRMSEEKNAGSLGHAARIRDFIAN